MSDRPVIVVDVETTGLDPAKHTVVELAAVDLGTGDHRVIVPGLRKEDLAAASPRAWTVNKYFERRVYEQAMGKSALNDALCELFGWLDGATLAGCNPAFDAAFLAALFADRCDEGVPTWHHRLADLSTLTAAALQKDPLKLPGLDVCCAWWGVTNQAPHTALGDAQATAECLRMLRAHCDDRGSVSPDYEGHQPAPERYSASAAAEARL
ncbi:3'-5' exonuclease [Tomitella gaofuii]|uniref:3'-5' exonuclease n=1 Tax=Tomitella gaofuii TaxID=2760083 RepID=UPI0015FDB980|nr:exonuclease domain-containing protein [Tomitella gaofuii]